MAIDLSQYVTELAEVVKDRRVWRPLPRRWPTRCSKADGPLHRWRPAHVQLPRWAGRDQDADGQLVQSRVTICGRHLRARRQGPPSSSSCLRSSRQRDPHAVGSDGRRCGARRRAGFNITERHAEDAFDAGIRAVSAVLDQVSF